MLPGKANITVMASQVLHNILGIESEETYNRPRFLDTDNNGNITQGKVGELMLLLTIYHSVKSLAIEIISLQMISLQMFCDFFNGPG